MRTPNNKFLLAIGLSFASVAVFAFRSRESVIERRGFPVVSPVAAKLSALPPTILWAWERPEKFDFIDPRTVGVAFLAKTIYLRGVNVVTRPRLQPLNVPDGTMLIAVARIESDRHERPQLTPSQIDATAAELIALAHRPNIAALQLDFDATVSERDFYRRLIIEVHEKLPNGIPLSITALASWCEGDRWLSGLPIDEAVPMLFRLGVEKQQFASRLRSGEKLRAVFCQAAAGVSTDELIVLPAVNRLYLFNPRAWTQRSFNDAMEAYHR